MNIYRFDSDRCILTSIEQEQEQQGQKQQQNTNQPSQASQSLRGPIKFAGGTPAEPKKTNPIPAFDEWEAEPENDQYGYEQGDDNNNNNNNNLTYVSQDSLYQKPQENWGYNNPNNNYALPQLPQQPQIQSQIQQPPRGRGAPNVNTNMSLNANPNTYQPQTAYNPSIQPQPVRWSKGLAAT